MSIFPKFFFTLFGNAPKLPDWLRSYIARVEEDGGTTVDRNHTKEVYADVIDYEPSLIQSCDSGSAGNLYSLFVNPIQLLDNYTGSAAAYSLRNLSTSTTNVVKVRRSGDDAELDFTASQVSGGALAAWVVAGGGTEDGFVTTWYDQSGNTNNATQATAANQPKIVSSGTLVTDNGKAALDFDGSGDSLTTNIPAISGKYTLLCLFRSVSYNIANIIFGLDQNNYYIRYDQFSGQRLNVRHKVNYAVSIASFYASNPSVPALTTYILEDQTTGTLTGYFNSVEVGSDSDGDYFGTEAGHSIKANLQTYIQELIIYDSDQSANRTGIEDNINDYYNIYS